MTLLLIWKMALKKNSKWREKIFYKITDQLVKKNLKIKIKKNTLAF